MPKFTKKHYLVMASIFKNYHIKDIELILKFTDIFEIDNPKFDGEKFFKACGIE